MRVKKRGQRVLSYILAAAMMVPTTSVPIVAHAEETRQTATYVGQIPEELADDSSIDGNWFDSAYKTVPVTSNGIQYNVEVVPENLVYFIDNFSNTPSEKTTPVYEAVKEIPGIKLKNNAADGISTEGSWGFVNQNISNKKEVSMADKAASGIYNDKECVLNYILPLEAGTYTITTGHNEWWGGQGRNLNISVKVDEGDWVTLGTASDLKVNQEKTVSGNVTLNKAGVVTLQIKDTAGKGAILSWLGVAEVTGGAPFGKSLEETDGALGNLGATMVEDAARDNVLRVTAGWNNQNSGHAVINDAQALFGRTEFTLLANVKIEDTEKSESVKDKKAAFTIGVAEQNIHILTQSGKFGYGGTQSDGGISTNNISLDHVIADDWNAMALVYEEKDGANGSVTIYLNGEKAGEVGDIGFKLSAMGNLSAMIGRSFSTSYLLNGLYDDIVVNSAAMTEEEAVSETKERLLSPLKKELESVVAEAREYMKEGTAGEEFQKAVADAETLLNNNNADKASISAAIDKIKELMPNYAATITIKGSDVDAAALMTNGLTYKGWGLLSCNGTSNLLMDYKAEAPKAYWEIIETLFGGEHPLLNHVKIEMGNDGNTSTAADPATIRYDGEEADASRSPGWQLAADARSVNPDVKVSVLRWRSPNWTNGNTNTEKVYEWYKETIFDAYEKYGILADYVAAGVNEAGKNDIPVSARMVREFTDLVENESDFPDYMDETAQNAYHNTKFISADEINSWAIVDELYNTKDQEGGTWEDVDTVGIHYVTGTDQKTRELATKYNKEVWYSEACATIGLTSHAERRTNTYVPMGGYQSPLAMVDGYLNSFVFNSMTHYIFQPAIGSFYDGLQYAHKDMVSAREPWAGYVRYDEALYMTAHFTQFSKAGWAEDDSNSNGIWLGIPQASDAYAGDNCTNEHLSNEAGEPSYMTLAAPDKSDFSVVAVNNSPKELTYKIKVEDMNLGGDTTLEIWQTKANEYMEFKGEVTPNAAGYYVVKVDAGAIATFTTLNYHGNDGNRALTLPEHTPLSEKAVLDTDDDGKMGENFAEVTDNVILYADDFEYDEEGTVTVNSRNGEEQQDYLYSRGNEPRYMMDTHGAWVVEEDGNGNQRLGQVLTSKVSEWNNGDPETIVGDYRWMNYRASIDVQNDNGYALLGIRQQTGMYSTDSGYNLYIEGETWKLRKCGTVLLSGSMPERKGDYYNLTLEGKDNIITAYVDGEVVASYVDNNKPYLMGRVFLGSPWKQTYFDNLKVERVPGYIPYATAFYDDHDEEVQYSDDWTLAGPGGGSADDWYRTTANNNTTGENTYVTFSGRGTGFALVGANGGNVKLDIYVDNELKREGYETNSSDRRYSTAVFGGQEMGDHTYKVVVKEGTITIDGVYILGETVPGGGIESLRTLVNECDTLQEENYMADKWQEFQTALAEAKEVLEKAEAAAQSEIDTAEAKLRAAKDALLRQDQPIEVVTGELPEHLATVTGKALSDEVLPTEVSVKLANGTEGKAAITWKNNTASTFSKVYAEAQLKGTVEGGKDLNVTIPVDVVPKELVYFIDSFDAEPEGKTTPVYEAVRELMGDQLKNDAADQISDGSKWGFNKTGVHTKSGNLNNKYDSGYYMGGGNPVIYYLPLDAGEYSLTVGVNEWWEPRSMKATVLTGDEELATGSLSLSGYGAQDAETLDFVLNEAATVTLRLDKTSSNDPVVSWLAVATQPEVLDIKGIRVETLPDKTDYLVGEELDTAGMVVVATLSNATRVELDEEQYTVSELDSSTPGKKVITVSAAGKDGIVYEDSFEVRVAEEVIEYYTTEIKVTSKPNKMKYYVGEELDSAGMVVKAYQKASPSDARREIEVKNYTTVYDFSKAGKANVDVTYSDMDEFGEITEFKDTFTVMVAEEPAEDSYYTTGLRIDRKPNKTTYKIDEPFDPEGMKVMHLEKASPSNAVRETELSTDELDYRYDFSTPGNKKVKVVYTGVDKNQEEKEFIKTIDVTVANEAPQGYYTEKIKVTSLPEKTIYRVGDIFAPAGMVVMASQVNLETGETVETEIKDYRVTPGIFMIKGEVKVTISYTSTDKNGDAKVFQDSFTVTVRSSGSGSSSGSSSSYVSKPAPKPSSNMNGGAWKQEANNWKYVKANGQQAKDEWGQINGAWYFFKEDGNMAANQWIQDAEKWYFLSESGAMYANNWALYKDQWYYLDQSGAMYESRWLEYNGTWYYLKEDGAMAKDTVTPDGYRVDAEGKWIQ